MMQSREEIIALCDKYGIQKYTINSDGSIDVNGDVNLFKMKLTELPLTFNKVTGKFNCAQNKLKTLKGSPREIGGYFRCGGNRLNDLVGGPHTVGGSYNCGYNKLTSLYGVASRIGGDFYCSDNENLRIFLHLFSRLDFPERKLFMRFNNYYDIWTPEFDKQAMLDLIEDIKDGLR